MRELLRGASGERLTPKVGHSSAGDRVIDGVAVRRPHVQTRSGRSLESVEHRSPLKGRDIQPRAIGQMLRILPLIKHKLAVRREKGKPGRSTWQRQGLRLRAAAGGNQI